MRRCMAECISVLVQVQTFFNDGWHGRRVAGGKAAGSANSLFFMGVVRVDASVLLCIYK